MFSITHAQERENNTFQILSWNVYMLPGIANLSKSIEKSDKRGRATEIATALNRSKYDIIVLQEVFYKPSKRILSRNLKSNYPYQYGPFNPSKLSLKTNSGLFILSKLPLKVLESIRFNACNGADCFAKKGAVLVEGMHHGNRFQVLGTHINAANPHWIKEEQFKQISELLEDFNLIGVPQIVCGDMNTSKLDEKKYNEMLQMLSVEDTESQKENETTVVSHNTIIDYIFLRENDSKISLVNKDVMWFPSKVKRTSVLNGNLSDHLALTATFKWKK